MNIKDTLRGSEITREPAELNGELVHIIYIKAPDREKSPLCIALDIRAALLIEAMFNLTKSIC